MICSGQLAILNQHILGLCENDVWWEIKKLKHDIQFTAGSSAYAVSDERLGD
jgi:hypothetical protein